MKQRLSFLDGMRGWGALAVYLFHLGSFFFFKTKFNFVDTYFYNTPLQIFSDGELAIFLFFIISGFSLSYKFFKDQGDINYLREASQYRYFRLLIPVFFAILLPYFLKKFHLMFNTFAYAGAYSNHIHFYSIFKYTFIDLPFIFGSNHALYGPIFWTIYLEFTASLVIFAFLALFGTWRLRFLIYLALIVPLYNLPGAQGLYFLFFAGVVICDLFCMQKNIDRKVTLSNRIQKTLTIIGLFIIILFYQYAIVSAQKVFAFNSKYFFAILLFILTLYIPTFSNFFSSKLSKFLGRISFSLYLTHFPILCSLSCFIFNFLYNKNYSLVSSSLITCCLTSIVVIFTAYVFSLFIEEGLLIKIKLALRKIDTLTLNRFPRFMSSTV